MDGCRFDVCARTVTRVAASRRHLTGGMFGAAVMFAVATLDGDSTLAKKKRKKKNKKKVTCPAGEARCPKGFPSHCCAADTTCCDTSRLGCCAV